MSIPPIAQVVVGLPVEGPFDYTVPDRWQEASLTGKRVFVPFGPQRRVGYVVGMRQKSPHKILKPILSVLDTAPALDERLLALTRKFAAYYGCSWGEAIETCLPRALRQKRNLGLAYPVVTPSKAVKEDVVLFHDQGGEKRWPFTIERIKKKLSDGQGVIFLVPEIAMIEDIRAVLHEHLSVPIAILDKRLTLKHELEEWLSVRRGETRLVVGTRSCVFAPVCDLGLIVCYEEDNFCYKQEQSPFYHARDVIFMRHDLEKAQVLFVGSTPSAELWHEAHSSKYNIETAQAEKLGDLQIIDLSNYKPRRGPALSFPLQNSIQAALAQKKKTVLFLNRRGFSTATRCQNCGYTVTCPRCNVNLTYLYSRKQLACRLCNFSTPVPKICPQCQRSYLQSVGTGIEKWESDIARFFPQAAVARFDRDTGQLPLQADIIIATQAIEKSLERFAASLIGVIDIDAQLNRLDFRCAQRVFSLLVRLRQVTSEKVIVQTLQPSNYSIKAAQKMDFRGFYRKELSFRRELGLPPFRHLVAVMIRGKQEQKAWEYTRVLFEDMSRRALKGIDLVDPQPDFTPKLRDKYRFIIMLKGKSLKRLHALIKASFKSVKKGNAVVTVNVDP